MFWFGISNRFTICRGAEAILPKASKINKVCLLAKGEGGLGSDQNGQLQEKDARWSASLCLRYSYFHDDYFFGLQYLNIKICFCKKGSWISETTLNQESLLYLSWKISFFCSVTISINSARSHDLFTFSKNREKYKFGIKNIWRYALLTNWMQWYSISLDSHPVWHGAFRRFRKDCDTWGVIDGSIDSKMVAHRVLTVALSRMIGLFLKFSVSYRSKGLGDLSREPGTRVVVAGPAGLKKFNTSASIIYFRGTMPLWQCLTQLLVLHIQYRQSTQL